MTWKTFGGTYQEISLGLVKQRCKKDGLMVDDEVISEQFWLHIYRGLGYLASDKALRTSYDEGRRSVRGLLEIGLPD